MVGTPPVCTRIGFADADVSEYGLAMARQLIHASAYYDTLIGKLLFHFFERASFR